MKITLKKFLKIFFVIFLIWVCIRFLMMSKKIVEGMKKLPPPIYASKAEAAAATAAEAAASAARKAQIQKDRDAYHTANRIAAQKAANEEQARAKNARASNVRISADPINDRFKGIWTW